MNIGKEQNNSDNNLEFDNICYPDDKDIDEFFQICKNLVKGGFSEESNKIQKAQFLFTAYNNISYIKINNIIIVEEDILKLGSNKANLGIVASACMVLFSLFFLLITIVLYLGIIFFENYF